MGPARIAALQGIFITQKLPDGATGVKVFKTCSVLFFG